ncbi:hypothetical protein AHAS_Ahas13G0465500 [Arachis hypogaea]
MDLGRLDVGFEQRQRDRGSGLRVGAPVLRRFGSRGPQNKEEEEKLLVIEENEYSFTQIPATETTDLTPMALEWVVLGYAAAAEAIMVLLLTIPGLDGLRRGLIAVTRNLLKPFLSVVPFCLFLLMDIYWKYETRPSCEGDSCTPTEHLRHQKSIMKSQRNALLIASALLFYWLLYSVTNLVVKIEQLNQRVERLKNRD